MQFQCASAEATVKVIEALCGSAFARLKVVGTVKENRFVQALLRLNHAFRILKASASPAERLSYIP